jgi:hypothetical protein
MIEGARKCTRCGKIKPADSAFHRNGRYADGSIKRSSWCKVCKCLSVRKYQKGETYKARHRECERRRRQANPEAVAIASRKYRRKHGQRAMSPERRDRRLEVKRLWNRSEKGKESKRKYRNRLDAKARQKETIRRWRKKNRARIKKLRYDYDQSRKRHRARQPGYTETGVPKHRTPNPGDHPR